MSQFGKLIVTTSGDGEQEFSLQKSAVEIGRATQNDIVINDEKVSRTHALIECSGEGCILIDLDSANGTKVNGAKIVRTALKPGDLVELGSSNLRFETISPAPEPEVTQFHHFARCFIQFSFNRDREINFLAPGAKRGIDGEGLGYFFCRCGK